MNAHDYKFTEEEIQTLKTYRDNEKNYRVKLRIIGILLLASNSVDFVATILGIVPRTITTWFQKYKSGGITSLTSFDYKPKQPKLNIYQINQVIIWVSYNNPDSIKEVTKFIFEKFNVDYCIETVRQILRKHGIKLIRAKMIPGNVPTIEEQRKFIEWYNDLKSNIKPGDKILFGDAMHLVHQSVNEYCWGNPKFPPILETNSSRQRLNILGAYDPSTHTIVHLTGEENCNAVRVIVFFQAILSAYPNTENIYIILDNAKYHHAKIVRDWLDYNKTIKCIFLPSYAPNLNLIERFWKFAKKKLVKRIYYKHYKNFRANVFMFLNNIDKYYEELKSLMVEKFQIVYA